MAEALYRKYRPQVFDDVVGQEHIERTLKNAIQSDKVSHAYLFTGPRGTGKTTTARLLSKALLCESGPTPTPDGTCEDCQLIALGEHPDVYELDAASRTGVENVREEIIGRVGYAPVRGRYKIYIIDEVHMLSTAAFNALLKTLEEPPEHVVFVLCTTDPQKIPETIQSRCQRFDFRRIGYEELIARLGYICGMEGVEYDADALDLIAHKADGGMRDALTSLEQVIAFGDGSVTLELAERLLGSSDASELADIVSYIGNQDVAGSFRWTSEYLETGADLAQFAQDLAEHMRNMYIFSVAGNDVPLDITEASKKELESEAAMFGPDRLSNILLVLGELISNLKTSTNQRLEFEIALTRMLRPQSDITLSSLASRIEALEAKFGQGMPEGLSQPSRSQQDDVAPNRTSQPKQMDASTINVSHPQQPDSAPRTTVQSAPQTDASSTQAEAHQRPVEAIKVDSSNIVRFWDAALAQLRSISEPYCVVLMKAEALADPNGDQKILIAFDESEKFNMETIDKPKAREALSEAFARAGAPGLTYDVIARSKGHVAPTTKSAPNERTQRQPQPSAAEEPQAQAQPSAAEEPQAKSQPQRQTASGMQSQDNATAQAQSQPAANDIAPKAQEEVPPEPSAEELNDFLASAFGEGLSFEEV